MVSISDCVHRRTEVSQSSIAPIEGSPREVYIPDYSTEKRKQGRDASPLKIKLWKGSQGKNDRCHDPGASDC